MKTRINPHAKGILIEHKEVEKTKSGVYLPTGTQKEDTGEYEGHAIIKVGKDVNLYKEGDVVMFFPHSISTALSFEISDNDGSMHKYMLFREADVACVVEPLNGKIIELPSVK